MSRPWRGGYTNRRPYSKGPRGGSYSKPRYSRWDHADDRYNNQSYRSAPVYMNSDSPAFWQDYYNEFQPQPCQQQQLHQQFQQQQQQQHNYEPSQWNNSSYNNYCFPSSPRGRQYSNHNSDGNNSNRRRHPSDNLVDINFRESANNVEELRQGTSRLRQDSETSVTKNAEEPVVAHPGSEAAREKERAEIAERLKQLDKRQEENKNESKSAHSKEKSGNSAQASTSSKDATQKKRKLSTSKPTDTELKRSKRSHEKVSSTTEKSKHASSKKEKSDSQYKAKESHSQKKLNESASKKTCSSKVSPAVPGTSKKRKEILPCVANQKHTKKSSTKKTSEQNQTSKKNTNQNQTTNLEKPSEGKNKILSRLSAMGKEELKSLINNPQLPKSQEMLKTLMSCYHEMKALELDKRRFSIATSSTSTSTEPSSTSENIADAGLLNFCDLASIAMSDLPSELVNQIETFLGCNISLPLAINESEQSSAQINGNLQNNGSMPIEFQVPNSMLYPNQTTPQQFAMDWSNVPMTSVVNPEQLNQQNTNSQVYTLPTGDANHIPDNISESSTEKAPSPYQSQLYDQQDYLGQPHFNNSGNFSVPLYFEPSLSNLSQDDQTPFHILNELSIIDLRIQTDIQRKMQLYKQLHLYLQNKRIQEQQNLNLHNRISIVSPGSNHSVEQFLPPPPSLLNQPTSNLVNSVVIPNIPDSSLQAKPSTSGTQASPNQLHQETVTSNFTQEPTNITQPQKDLIVLTLDDDSNDDSQLTTISSNQTQESDKSCVGCRPLKPSPDKITVNLPSKIKVNDMKFVNRDMVVIGCDDCIIYAYNLTTGKVTHKFRKHESPVTVVLPIIKKNDKNEVIKGEFMLCSGGLDERLCFFDSQSQQCISNPYLASSITCMELLPPNILYIGVHCGQIFMCNTDTRQLMGTPMDCGSNSILSILATREGPRKVLIVSSVGRGIAMRDAQNGLLLRSFESTWQQKTFSLVVYGNLLVGAGMKKCIPYFNLMNGQQEGELNVSSNVAHITNYKHLLFVACCMGQVFVFDLKTKEKLMEFQGADSILKTIEVTNNKIITCGRTKKMTAICFPPEVVRSLRSSCTCKSS